MNKEGHILMAMYFMIFIVMSGLVTGFFQGKELLAFFVAYVIFSANLNPDIDQKIPFLAHRGATHNYIGLIGVALGVFLLAYVAKVYLNFGFAGNIIFAFAIGASIAWLIHILTDMVYDRFRGLAWLIVVVPIIFLLR